ncbi:glycosyltransferase [Kocuria tytonicola]|uniref:glycosyltransferase family 2 protein n=1 Tax=Kocuria tytonicola TaxID=2055946 RepID=UPI000EF96F4D|nr:glycosyltransferase [Kocuria tytonicola]RLZ03290.1 glycosyltransferase [Kocuria tytonicola]
MDDLLTPPLVDIVIPVHSTARPLERAVRSALRASEGAGPGQCRVLVVAHHLREREVLAMLPESLRAAVTVFECENRGSTAAVPRNEALRRSTARYVSFLDSDDTLDPGAVTRWLGIAERRGSDLVIPFQHHEAARVDITPIIRPFRSARLDPVKDRLGYRSTCFGLVRTAAARSAGALFDEEVRTGEDQAFVVALYSAAQRIDYAPGLPGYFMRDDAETRVSTQPFSVRETTAAVSRLRRHTWFAGLPPELRASLALKYLRVNVLPGADTVLRAGTWGPGSVEDALAAVQDLLAFAPHVEDRLSSADRKAVALLRASAGAEELRHALAERRAFASPGALLTRNVRWVLDRQSPLRIAAASAAQMARYEFGRRRQAQRRA